MPKASAEFSRFTALTDRLLTVSKETVDARISAYEAERETIPRDLRPGRSPKPTPKRNPGRAGGK